MKDTPWYENGLLLTAVSLCVGLLIALYFFRKGPAPEGQNQILAKQDETLAIIHRMEVFQKENDPKLKAKFNLGYILFTATEAKQIVPLKSLTDSIRIDWKAGYSISLTEDRVTLLFSNASIHLPGGSVIALENSSVGLLRRIEPWARPGIYNDGKVRVAFKVVDTNADAVMIAMGVQSPPEPRPPMSELMK